MFIMPSVVPLVPGGPLYYAMSEAVRGNMQQAGVYGRETLLFALAIASGIYTFISKSSPSSSSASPIFSTNQPEAQYTSKNEVAKYICENGHLPSNYVSKSEGKRLYEQKTGRNFTKWNFNPLSTLDVMIGGDYFENREGLLPQGTWYEADVDYFASNRGTNRLVYSSGCNIYYTSNHYKSFSKVEFGQ